MYNFFLKSAMWQHSHDSSSCNQCAGCDTDPCLFVFVSASDFKSSARCPRRKTLAEDQQKPGALRHHVDLLQPWHGDGLLGDSRGCLWKPLAVWHTVHRGGRVKPRALQPSLMQNTKTLQSGSPPLFPQRSLRMWMITVAEKNKRLWYDVTNPAVASGWEPG